jgi:hypothetical protein
VAIAYPWGHSAGQKPFGLLTKTQQSSYYIVPHEPQDLSEASPFQGFTPGILNTAQAFGIIAGLPRNIMELFSTPDEIIEQR